MITATIKEFHKQGAPVKRQGLTAGKKNRNELVLNIVILRRHNLDRKAKHVSNNKPNELPTEGRPLRLFCNFDAVSIKWPNRKQLSLRTSNHR